MMVFRVGLQGMTASAPRSATVLVLEQIATALKVPSSRLLEEDGGSRG